MGRDGTQVGCQTEAAAVLSDGKAHRIGGIMGDGKRVHHQIVNLKSRAAVESPDFINAAADRYFFFNFTAKIYRQL